MNVTEHDVEKIILSVVLQSTLDKETLSVTSNFKVATIVYGKSGVASQVFC